MMLEHLLRHRTIDRTRLTTDDGWDLAALVIAACVLVLTAVGAHSPIRGLLALSFLTLVPGWAVVTNWSGAAKHPRAALSVLFSLAICTLAATISLWAHLWHPFALFDICAVVSGVALVRSLRRRHRPTQTTPVEVQA